MKTIEAGQHLYANVERAHSPKGYGGFQTLYQSPGWLTAADEDDLELRITYADAPRGGQKKVFCQLPSGLVAVSQVQALSEPDAFGRTGRFVAHTLLFQPASLVAVGANPFAIFRHFSFVDEIEAACNAGDFATGEIAPIPLSCAADQAAIDQATLDSAQRKTVALYALQAPDLQEAGNTLALPGRSDEVAVWLESAVLAVPPALRLLCSFDTDFRSGHLGQTPYWAVGGLSAAKDRRLIDPLLQTAQPKTAYQRWAAQQLSLGKDLGVGAALEQAFAIAAWLEEAGPLEAPPAPLLWSEMVKANQAMVAQQMPRLVTALLKQGQPNALVALAPLVSHATRTDLHQLVTAIQPYELPRPFTEAVARALAGLPKQGFWERLKHWGGGRKK